MDTLLRSPILPRRQQDVLRATVRHYVDTVEPVGSRTLVQRFGLPASPATVRSAMGALEQWQDLNRSDSWSWSAYGRMVDCVDRQLTALEAALPAPAASPATGTGAAPGAVPPAVPTVR
mgnify:CR=1 FL=1